MTEINKQDFTSKLSKIFSANGLSSYLSLERMEKFYTLTVRMLEENEKYNLTAITDPDKIILNHYADCVAMASKLKKGASIIDVGCGAGFPSLPLAIVRPDLRITAVDSTAKRINYVSETARMLGLDNLTAVVMRAEDGGKSPEYREKFDYATARAVAEMRVLSELSLPFVKIGGQMVAMKGKNAEFELFSARKAIATLGGRNTLCENITLKGEGETLTHPLIIIDKKDKTPASFPRPFAQISKKPL
nr:16S rRNA (guanine(527)-N(7))-methyltransferase RsmG [Oscillospiraceae bacterium]